MAQLVDTDVLLVNRADVTYTMTFAELQQSVLDKLIGGLTLSGDPLPEFDDSDQFLVNRENVTYKISFAELIDSITLAVPPVLTNVSLVENNPGVSPRFTSQAFTASSTLSEDGIPQSEKTIDAYVEGAILEDVQFNEPLESSGTTTSPVYSNYLTAVAGFQPGSPATNLFADPPDTSYTRTNGGGTVVDFSPPNLLSGTFESYTAPNSEIVVYHDGGETRHTTSGAEYQYLFPETFTNITRITVQRTENLITQMVWFKLNGRFLIDSEILTELTFANGTDMTTLEASDTVNQGATTGTVGFITGTTVTLYSSSGAWVDGVNVTGPTKQLQVDGTKKYLDFDSNGNVSSLLDTPQDPAYITTDINPGLTFTFPATFPSGLTPDEELGDGTTLTVTVKAENEGGTSGPLSDTVQPEVINDFTSPIESIGTVNETIQWVNYVGEAVIISDDGLDLAKEDGNSSQARATGLVRTTGKYYYEIRVVTNVAVSQDRFDIGWGDTSSNNAYWLIDNKRFWGTQNGRSFVKTTHYLPNNGTDYIVMCAINYDSRKIWYGIDGAWYKNEIPSSNSNSYFKYDLSVADEKEIGMRITHSMGQPGCETFINPAPQYAPSGFSIVADYDQLVFETDKNFDKFAKEKPIYQLDKNANGICGVPNNASRSIKLRSSEGTWEVGQQCSPEVVIRSLTSDELEAQKLMFATYENRKMVNCGQQAQAERDALRATLIEAGYTEPEIASAYSGTTTPATPVEVAGYYPLYETEADANTAGNGTSHSHTFNGVTYYMPDGGVTIYHGNYGY